MTDKESLVLNNIFISNYFMLVAYSQLRSLKLFSGVTFRAKFGVVLATETISIGRRKSLEI